MICEGCLAAIAEEAEAFFDEDEVDPELLAILAAESGADIADHVCDEPAECGCPCTRYALPARKRRRK